jgi:hypothetical protein
MTETDAEKRDGAFPLSTVILWPGCEELCPSE